jgi:selenide,water dikinase
LGRRKRGWNGLGRLLSPEIENLLYDPQTSGGLLVACDPKAEKEVLQEFTKRGFGAARVIGKLSAGAPRLTVT